ncbi:threonine/homoserine/homoserine lactone efflux protein [Nocardiopsis sp. L17-MgMaSL7]|nr:threonine/homoserine/homoserine lactone efflux protein [Nocardiopsis sp. L17-MgMaSL7]
MDAQQALASFVVFSLIVTVTPGPATVIVLRNGIMHGVRPALSASFGAALGSLAWGFAAAVGVAAVVARSDAAFEALRYAGAAYLAYLGVRTALERSPAYGPDPEPEPASTPSGRTRVRPVSMRRWFRQGLLADLLSPKAGLFFLAVLPQFVPQGWAPMPAMMLLSLVDCLLVATWLGFLSFFAHYALRRLHQPVWYRTVQIVCGLTLVLLALHVVTVDPGR